VQAVSSARSAEAANSCVILSSSRNADSISSERTTNLLQSSRCASTIQIVRPLESTVETQPHVQPHSRDCEPACLSPSSEHCGSEGSSERNTFLPIVFCHSHSGKFSNFFSGRVSRS